MIKKININERILASHQYGDDTSDPKNKRGQKTEKVVNGQEDNSYDEGEESKEIKTKEPQAKQGNTNKDFEYSDSGEFENDSFATDTNPKDDYL